MDKLSVAALVLGLSVAPILTGCGTPAAPQPPSLNLPERVTDLAALRAGNRVSLSWTMPKRNTDKLLLKGSIAARVCRKTGASACEAASADLLFAPGAGGSFTDTLPAALADGSPRVLSYFVELRNHNGRSAGPSNPAQVLAGEAPAPVANLTAEVRKQGIVLRWTSAGAASSESTAVRLHRKLLNPPAAKPREGPLEPQAEPLEQNLLVDRCAPEAGGSCRAIDKSIHFGASYEYRLQRVARITVDGKTLELAGELSAPVRVEARDVFPPEIPSGLAAVATAGESGAGPAAPYAIDLSWQPVTDLDLAGYIVYRSESEGTWQRISPAGPLVSPAFHDMQVQPGHTYRYAVSAVDQNGHESARSAETEETVPKP